MKKNIYSKNIPGKRIKLSFKILLLILGFSFRLSAQNNVNGNDINILTDSTNHKVVVEFSAGKIIYNLLVLVTDSNGYTIFLDNQYQFLGKYKREIDLKPGKGKYSLQVIRDEARFNRKIIIQ